LIFFILSIFYLISHQTFKHKNQLKYVCQLSEVGGGIEAVTEESDEGVNEVSALFMVMTAARTG